MRRAAPAEKEHQTIMPIPSSTCELKDGHVELQNGRSILKTENWQKKKPVANVLQRHIELEVGSRSPLTLVRSTSESIICYLVVAHWN